MNRIRDFEHGGWTSNGRDWPRLWLLLLVLAALGAFWLGIFILALELIR